MSAEKHVAIVLAGGSGRRMGMDMPKQYLAVGGKPLIYFALKAFQDSAMDEIVLVCGRGETDFCRTRIVEQYELTKVKQIVEGGAERYHSVWEGLKAAGECDYIYVHDGARPFLEQETICRLMASVKQEKACVAAVPVKDTIKVTDADGVVVDTPPRDRLWTVQTPQSKSGLCISVYSSESARSVHFCCFSMPLFLRLNAHKTISPTSPSPTRLLRSLRLHWHTSY